MKAPVALALLAAAVAAGAAVFRAAADRPPNVIVIAVDTLRADALGAYGAPGDPTPALDRFAAGAVQFEQAVASACWTLPSFASMLTGLYPEAHGVLRPDHSLPHTFTTLAEVLQGAGYRTAAFTAGGYLTRMFGLSQGFDVFDDVTDTGRFREKLPRALEWMSTGGDQPFFVLLHGYDVHSPYAPDVRPAPPKGYEPPADDVVQRLLDGLASGQPPRDLAPGAAQTAYLTIDPGGERALAAFRKAFHRWSGTLARPVDALWASSPDFERELEWVRRNYDAEVRQLDRDLGAFLDRLAASGLLERSVVVLVSDHGEAFMEHGVTDHQVVDDVVAHVPLVIRAPGGGGRRVADVVRGIDLFPTLLELCGTEPPGFCQGRSLVPLMAGGTAPAEPACCFQNATPGRPPEISVRWHQWKLVTGGRFAEHEPPHVLFDLAADPAQRNDLAAAAADVATRLAGALARVREQCARFRALHQTARVRLDPDALRELTELGYLGMLPDAGTDER